MGFEQNTRVHLNSAPDRVGRITGKIRERAGRRRFQVDFGDKMEYVIEGNLRLAEEELDTYEQIERGQYGGVINLRSAITHTRLTGRLADVIYSMEVSNTEFFPYQFKPVLNFLESPSKGILIADEVGLGKTSEGVDLQFSSFIINYDLPWNPMRVEQRIGRIDRIGQKEKKIHIRNFFM